MQKLLLKDFFFKFYLERQCMKKKRCMSYNFINMVYENSLKYELN